MQKYFLGLSFLVFTLSASGQTTSGLTGKRDTSYTNYSAYQSTRKQHPDIKLVREKLPPTVREKRNITYCRIGDRNLMLDAFYPKNKTQKKVPGVLIIHGGGWRSGDRSQHIPLAQRLAGRGYACFTAEYRLSTEALYPAAVHDLKAALRWMRANAAAFNLDTARIVALGFSAGGELAAFIGATNKNPLYEGGNCHLAFSSQVQAIVDIDGTLSFVHPESGEGDDSRSISAATHWFGYPKKANPALWEEASPLKHVGRNTPPILFLNSSVERMHAGRDDFRKELAKYHVYSEAHTFPNAPHSFCLFEPWFEPTVNYIADFLDKVFRK